MEAEGELMVFASKQRGEQNNNNNHENGEVEDYGVVDGTSHSLQAASSRRAQALRVVELWFTKTREILGVTVHLLQPYCVYSRLVIY